MSSVSKRSACFWKRAIRSGPCTPSASAGQLSTSVVVISWPPCARPVISTGLQIGTRRVYCGGVSGGAGAQDDESGVLGGHWFRFARGTGNDKASCGPSLADVGSAAARSKAAAPPSRAAGRAYNAVREVRAASPCFSIGTCPPIARPRRRAANGGTDLSPRFARLVRESWWLLVVAAVGYLALILATYTTTDPGWSFSGTGAPHRQPRRRRRRVARRSPALSLRRVGVVVGHRRRRARHRRLSPHRAARGNRRASAFVPLRWASASSCSRAPRSRRCASSSSACVAARAGRRVRRRARPRGIARLRLQRRDAAAARVARRGLVAVVRHLVAARDGAHRRGPREPRRPRSQAARGSRRPQDRRGGGRRARAGGRCTCARKSRTASPSSSCRNRRPRRNPSAW